MIYNQTHVLLIQYSFLFKNSVFHDVGLDTNGVIIVVIIIMTWILSSIKCGSTFVSHILGRILWSSWGFLVLVVLGTIIRGRGWKPWNHNAVETTLLILRIWVKCSISRSIIAVIFGIIFYLSVAKKQCSGLNHAHCQKVQNMEARNILEYFLFDFFR